METNFGKRNYFVLVLTPALLTVPSDLPFQWPSVRRTLCFLNHYDDYISFKYLKTQLKQQTQISVIGGKAPRKPA